MVGQHHGTASNGAADDQHDQASSDTRRPHGFPASAGTRRLRGFPAGSGQDAHAHGNVWVRCDEPSLFTVSVTVVPEAGKHLIGGLTPVARS